MTKAKDTTSDDWLSAPVGNAPDTGSTPVPAAADAAEPGTSSESAGPEAGSAVEGDSTPSTGSTEAPADQDVSESVTATGSKYKSSFTKNLASGGGSLYPTGSTPAVGGGSPALAVDPTPGPATSVGLGSASTTTTRGRRAAAGPRRAKLQLRHIDPWSTLKLSLVLAVAFFFVWMIAVAILYGVLSTMGVFESIDSMFAELGGEMGTIVTPKIVFGGAALIGAINIVLFTALATIGAYIYNLCADLAGGLEITLAERR